MVLSEVLYPIKVQFKSIQVQKKTKGCSVGRNYDSFRSIDRFTYYEGHPIKNETFAIAQ